MNTGQTLLSLGAVALLSFLILRVNTLSVETQEDHINTRLGVVALSFANSYLDLIRNKAFDEVVLDSTISNIILSNLTYPPGAEPGEIFQNFDDIDDYNLKGVVLEDTTTLVNSVDPAKKTKIYYTSNVYYVNSNNPSVIQTSRQWNKRIDVKVWTKEMKDTIKLSLITGYW